MISSGWRDQLSGRYAKTVERYGPVAIGATALACALIIASAIAMLASGFRGMGDGGAIAVRALDVGTRNTPLLGTRSSVAPDPSIGIMHHPGPIQFYLLAPFVRLFGDRGLPIAGAFSNLVWMLTLVWASAKAWGREGAVGAAFASVLMVGSLGVTDASSIWPPVAIIFPLAVTLVAAWSVIRRIPGSWWLLIAAGTFVAQSNLPSAPTVAIALLAAAVAAAIQRTSPRTLVGPTLMGLVLWIPPIIEQFTDKHPNIQAILHSAGTDATVGLSRSFRTISVLVSSPFGWAGTPYGKPWMPGAKFPFEPPHARPAIVGLIVGALVVLGSVALATRRDRRGTALGVGACGGLLIFAVLIFSNGPFTGGFVSNGWMRWIWSIAIAFWAATIVAGLKSLSGRPRAYATVAFASFCVIPIPSILATTGQEIRSTRSTATSLETMETAIRAAARDERTILIECDYMVSASTPVLLSDLETDGKKVYLGFPDLGAREREAELFGDERNLDFPANRSRDSVAIITIRQVVDPAASYAAPGDRVIASTVLSASDAATLDRLNAASSLSPAETATRDRLRDQVRNGKVVAQLVMFRPSAASGGTN